MRLQFLNLVPNSQRFVCVLLLLLWLRAWLPPRKTLSVSTFASAIASSTPEPSYCGVADSDAGDAGADDEEAAVDAVCAAGP